MNRPVRRRDLLIAAGITPLIAACGTDSGKSSTTATSTSATSGSGSSTGFNPLWIPPLLKGPHFDLELAPSSATLLDGKKVDTIAYNGAAMWGPTLEMQAGDTVTATVTNKLGEETTTHWHGIHLPAEMDGGPHQVIEPEATWKPTWTVKNQAATYWYHPHAHELTWKQMNQGAGGFIIVRDDQEAALDLPRTYGVDDIPLVLTSRAFTSDGEIDTERIYGDYLLANGVMNAELEAPAQMVRLRILNAEIERAYTIGFDDDRKFSVIGTDGGLLDAPVTTNRLVIFPGERYEIVVDLSADAVGSSIQMQSYNTGQNQRAYPGSEPDGNSAFSSKLNNRDFDLLRLTVTAATPTAIAALPAALAANALWAAADATNERTITINDGVQGLAFYFNDAVYSMDRIDERVELGTTEAWHIQNTQIFSHAFHIHDVQFAIVERSTGPVPDHEKGWKDTLHIVPNELVTFVAKFDDYASDEHPFMYHCHMSNHEDEGMMGQFLVTTEG